MVENATPDYAAGLVSTQVGLRAAPHVWHRCRCPSCSDCGHSSVFYWIICVCTYVCGLYLCIYVYMRGSVGRILTWASNSGSEREPAPRLLDGLLGESSSPLCLSVPCQAGLVEPALQVAANGHRTGLWGCRVVRGLGVLETRPCLRVGGSRGARQVHRGYSGSSEARAWRRPHCRVTWG